MNPGNNKSIPTTEKDQVRVGQIHYLNLVPFFKELVKLTAELPLQYTEGVPSHLNDLLRTGVLDVSPASSICLLDDSLEAFAPVGVRTNGPVQSVYLSIPEGGGVSSKDFYQALAGKKQLPLGPTIWTSSESETSVQLCKLLAREVFGDRFQVNKSSLPKPSDWQLWIGDQALQKRHQFADVIDLSEAWKSHTGKGFVFAKWVCRKAWKNAALDAALIEAASKADYQLDSNPEAYWDESLKSRGISKDVVFGYWQNIRYKIDAAAESELQCFLEAVSDS